VPPHKAPRRILISDAWPEMHQHKTQNLKFAFSEQEPPMIIEFKGIKPKIGSNVFIAPTATVIGDVEIHDNANIWFGTVVRGDRAPIVIGRNTNIQDNCTLHTDADSPAVVGDNVTIGHNAVVHGCIIEDRCLIGISAVVLSHARVRTGSVVAAGSVVIEGQQIGPYQLATGVPARIKKSFTGKTAADIPQSVYNYLKLSTSYSEFYKNQLDPKVASGLR